MRRNEKGRLQVTIKLCDVLPLLDLPFKNVLKPLSGNLRLFVQAICCIPTSLRYKLFSQGKQCQ